MFKTKWMETLKEKYRSGISNLFMITGNIGDYAVPGVFMKDYLIHQLSELGMERIVSYDYSEGSVYHKGTSNNESNYGHWLKMIKELQSTDKKTAYIIEYPEFLVPNDAHGYLEENTKKRLIDLHKVINGKKFLTSNNMLIFLTESKSNVNSIFISSNARTFPITIEYPNEEERLEFIRHLESTSTNEKPIQSDISMEKFAKLTAGLSRVNIEDIYLLAESKGILDKRMIMERKKELIYKEFGEIIEIFDTEGYSLDMFAGQENIKEYHREVVIAPILEGDVSIVPKGLLYMGPPGTGKTYFAKCLAGDANINFVEFKMSKILDKYVGEAEKNLEKAFSCFQSLAPVGVFIDEIDQALTRGDDESNSVTRNLFGMFLSFLSEPSHRGKILWIGATNYPNKLDEALKRAGRFDKKIPFLPPSKEERKEVFLIHLKKNQYPYEVLKLDELAEKTEMYTQAEIENVVVKALEIAKRKKYPKINDDILLYALECIVPTQNDRIKEMTDLALKECNDREFLPKGWEETSFSSQQK